MPIVTRYRQDGSPRYQVRIAAYKGRKRNIGTFTTLREAVLEERKALAKRSLRREKREAEGPRIDDHWLYHCYDASDALLYVGITSGGIKRFRRHGNEKSWWREIVRIEITHLATREDAEQAERAAIARLGPLHNRLLNGTRRTPDPVDAA